MERTMWEDDGNGGEDMGSGLGMMASVYIFIICLISRKTLK